MFLSKTIHSYIIILDILEENSFVIIVYKISVQKKYLIVILKISLKLMAKPRIIMPEKVNTLNSKIMNEK